MGRLDDFRQVFAQVVAARGDCEDPRIREAFARVPRHEFVGPAPWYFTEHGAAAGSNDPAILYQDVPMGLARERGIPTGLPSLHARALDACDIRAGERVVHVGAGAGYYTAILAELVGKGGQVLGYEIDAALAASAAEHLRPRSCVRRASCPASVQKTTSTGASAWSRPSVPAHAIACARCGVLQRRPTTAPGTWGRAGGCRRGSRERCGWRVAAYIGAAFGSVRVRVRVVPNVASGCSTRVVHE